MSEGGMMVRKRGCTYTVSLRLKKFVWIEKGYSRNGYRWIWVCITTRAAQVCRWGTNMKGNMTLSRILSYLPQRTLFGD